MKNGLRVGTKSCDLRQYLVSACFMNTAPGRYDITDCSALPDDFLAQIDLKNSDSIEQSGLLLTYIPQINCLQRPMNLSLQYKFNLKFCFSQNCKS